MHLAADLLRGAGVTLTVAPDREGAAPVGLPEGLVISVDRLYFQVNKVTSATGIATAALDWTADIGSVSGTTSRR